MTCDLEKPEASWDGRPVNRNGKLGRGEETFAIDAMCTSPTMDERPYYWQLNVGRMYTDVETCLQKTWSSLEESWRRTYIPYYSMHFMQNTHNLPTTCWWFFHCKGDASHKWSAPQACSCWSVATLLTPPPGRETDLFFGPSLPSGDQWKTWNLHTIFHRKIIEPNMVDSQVFHVCLPDGTSIFWRTPMRKRLVFVPISSRNSMFRSFFGGTWLRLKEKQCTDCLSKMLPGLYGHVWILSVSLLWKHIICLDQFGTTWITIAVWSHQWYGHQTKEYDPEMAVIVVGHEEQHQHQNHVKAHVLTSRGELFSSGEPGFVQIVHLHLGRVITSSRCLNHFEDTPRLERGALVFILPTSKSGMDFGMSFMHFFWSCFDEVLPQNLDCFGKKHDKMIDDPKVSDPGSFDLHSHCLGFLWSWWRAKRLGCQKLGLRDSTGEKPKLRVTNL